jgi:cysteinyl-tRNA synthetase
VLDEVIALKKIDPALKLAAIAALDARCWASTDHLSRTDLRLRPRRRRSPRTRSAVLDARRAARAAKDFARSDALRDELAAQGVDAMDGDPLGWDWRLG